MKRQIYSRLLLIAALFASVSMQAQDSLDLEGVVIEDRVRKNIVRVNITNPLIFGDHALILGYERMVSDYQSFSINGGLATFPKFNLIKLVDDSIVQLYKDVKDRGFNFTGDYRFYLRKENKFKAPHGLYVGPFVSHVFMGRDNRWNLNTPTFQGEVNSELKLNMTAVGAQLGYQFILWKRVALDLVLLGPSIAWYTISAHLDTDLDPDEESLLYEKINDVLEERFPGYTFVVDDVDFKKTGTTNTRSYGYRYTVHIGFHF